jgi:hypothetical protein
VSQLTGNNEGSAYEEDVSHWELSLKDVLNITDLMENPFYLAKALEAI